MPVPPLRLRLLSRQSHDALLLLITVQMFRYRNEQRNSVSVIKDLVDYNSDITLENTGVSCLGYYAWRYGFMNPPRNGCDPLVLTRLSHDL